MTPLSSKLEPPALSGISLLYFPYNWFFSFFILLLLIICKDLEEHMERVESGGYGNVWPGSYSLLSFPGSASAVGTVNFFSCEQYGKCADDLTGSKVLTFSGRSS